MKRGHELKTTYGDADNISELCPLCLSKGKRSSLEILQLNLTEATILCTDIKCPYPFHPSYEDIFIKRDFMVLSIDESTRSATKTSQHPETDAAVVGSTTILKTEPDVGNIHGSNLHIPIEESTKEAELNYDYLMDLPKFDDFIQGNEEFSGFDDAEVNKIMEFDLDEILFDSKNCHSPKNNCDTVLQADKINAVRTTSKVSSESYLNNSTDKCKGNYQSCTSIEQKNKVQSVSLTANSEIVVKDDKLLNKSEVLIPPESMVLRGLQSLSVQTQQLTHSEPLSLEVKPDSVTNINQEHHRLRSAHLESTVTHSRSSNGLPSGALKQKKAVQKKHTNLEYITLGTPLRVPTPVNVTRYKQKKPPPTVMKFTNELVTSNVHPEKLTVPKLKQQLTKNLDADKFEGFSFAEISAQEKPILRRNKKTSKPHQQKKRTKCKKEARRPASPQFFIRPFTFSKEQSRHYDKT